MKDGPFILLVSTLAWAGPASAAGTAADRAQSEHLGATLDVNELRLGVTNVGWFVRGGVSGGLPALEWPRDSTRSILFAGGLWFGARAGSDTLVTVAEYQSEYAAGPLDAIGQPVDPTESDPAHRVYKIEKGDDASKPDYAEWPAILGAPVDETGQPLLLGDQTLWCVYNDAVAAKHTVRPGHTRPLGIEVRQTVHGWCRDGPLGRMAFVDIEILKKGGETLTDFCAAFWFDPDLGSASDDLVGSDPSLDLGYVYNSGPDPVHGPHVPAFGCVVLRGPIVAGDTLGMTAFGRLRKNSDEPDSSVHSYRRMFGQLRDGSPQLCDGIPTRFDVSGDPVTASGCLDVFPADRRMMVTTGPVTLAPGDTTRVSFALIVGGQRMSGDALSNITRLRDYARIAHEVHAGILPADPACVSVTRPRIARVLPNPGGDAQSIELVLPAGITRGELRVFDIHGRLVWRQRLAALVAGTNLVPWRGENLEGGRAPSGIYLARLAWPGGETAAKFVRMR